ncbi:MAG TPA: CaiB/BaiF CoA-transferase family protein [Enteractinococcus sp.]
MTKPLEGVRIVEFAGLGPAPHACMVLADLGADIVRIERPNNIDHQAFQHTLRGRSIVEVDLKSESDRYEILDLISHADVLVEGFRPGVMERLELGPDHTFAMNPRLIYARMTGWGQHGPMAQRAGHDINYISLTGALHAIGTTDQPMPPLNLVGDYGGGSMMLVVGVLSALYERERTGEGKIVDAAMVDGVSVLIQQILEFMSKGMWNDTRETNFLDGAAPYYRTYRCADGGYVAVGAIEPPFYSQLLAGLGLDEEELPDRNDPRCWKALADILAARFAANDRDHWTTIFGGTDACVTPVLSIEEAHRHEHIAARRSIIRSEGGSLIGTPAPRFQSHGDREGTEESESSTTVTTITDVLDSWVVSKPAS